MSELFILPSSSPVFPHLVTCYSFSLSLSSLSVPFFHSSPLLHDYGKSKTANLDEGLPEKDEAITPREAGQGLLVPLGKLDLSTAFHPQALLGDHLLYLVCLDTGQPALGQLWILVLSGPRAPTLL
jgi:hypothetical protein